MSFQGIPVQVGNTVGDGTGTPVNLLTDAGGKPQVVPVTGGTQLVGDSGQVAAASAVATLAKAAGKLSYLSGFVITGLGATAATSILVSITGLEGGTMTFTVMIPAGATVDLGQKLFQFATPLKASAVNTDIVVTVPSFGSGNLKAQCTAWGFQI